MTKTKYLLYAFRMKQGKTYRYWYESDRKYFKENKPIQSILSGNTNEKNNLDKSEMIDNPWNNWNSKNIQTITTSKGVCINYLKSTNQDLIQKEEDLKLLELYYYLVENFDVSKSFNFNTVKKWHKEVFKTIYPFAGDLRTVVMSKGGGDDAWEWRLEFLDAIPNLDGLIIKISKTNYDDIDTITMDLAQLICEFLFVHPFREGNGRLSRLVCDIILAKNGFPMIGLNLKNGDNYIEKVHQGYNCDYEPMKELLKSKIEEIMNG
jgi:cell filamentation protein